MLPRVSILAAVARVVLDPLTAGTLAAHLLGAPELAAELAATCRRESGCAALGVHVGDLGGSVRAWRNAAAVGWLDPDACAWHRLEAGPWSTSGPWGAYRAYTWVHLGSPCVPVQLLDVPLVGAIAVGLRMIDACERYGACDRASRRRLWAGARLTDQRAQKVRRYRGVLAVLWSAAVG